MTIKSYNVFGYRITPLTAGEQIALVDRHMESEIPCVLAHLNLHGMHMMQSEAEMKSLHQEPTTHVVIDGMPLIALSRLAGVQVTREHRVTNLDLIWPLLSLAEKKHRRVYYLGGTAEVLERGLAVIRKRLPSLEIRGHHGYVGIDSSEVVSEIREFEANLILVGMGMGRQEQWIWQNANAVAPSVIMPVGALLEYIAGAVRTPPRWMGRVGLEWLFRLVENPRRFWKRYLVEPWSVAFTIAEKIGNRLEL